MNATRSLLIGLCAAALLAGCATQTPHLDEQFGSAVQAAARQQVLNPATPPRRSLPASMARPPRAPTTIIRSRTRIRSRRRVPCRSASAARSPR
ncbi:hypothetical protein LP420_31060 [Massilia sp. B-10]|nr:hypothetical protein LP420_31060 [Massilia sp. B-10]